MRPKGLRLRGATAPTCPLLATPLGHAPRSGPEIKNRIISAKDGAPERLRCGTIKGVSKKLQMMSAGAAT